jgi:hypothetical protein
VAAITPQCLLRGLLSPRSDTAGRGYRLPTSDCAPRRSRTRPKPGRIELCQSGCVFPKLEWRLQLELRRNHAVFVYCAADDLKHRNLLGQISCRCGTPDSLQRFDSGNVHANHDGKRNPTVLGTAITILLEHDPENACPALDAGWEPVLGKDHAPPKS